MQRVELFNTTNMPGQLLKAEIVKFLFTNLEQFGDPYEDIMKAVNFALKETVSFGGFILVGYEEEHIVGAVVVNQTGMDGYIPANILVYIATHTEFRGKGIGKMLMKKAIELCKGGIALHVEPENPARILYEKLGFSSKYLEMRLAKV